MMPYKAKAKAKACQKAWADKQGKEYWKQRYQDYKEQYQEKGQTYRLQVLIHNSKTDDDAGTGTSLSNIPFCACCGEKTLEFLSLDHIKGGGTKHREEVSVYTNGLSRTTFQKAIESFAIIATVLWVIMAIAPILINNKIAL